MELFVLLFIIAICAWFYFIWRKMSHFEDRKIPHVRPISFLGDMVPVFFRRMSLAENIRRMYNMFPNVKYFGFYEFTTPIYVICDPDLISSIAIKNFDHFCDHRDFVNLEIEKIVSRNLFNQHGDNWRKMRKVLSPCYTSSKMKLMFDTISQCAEYFTDWLATDSGKFGKTYNMKDIMNKFSTDVVAMCSLGIEVDSLKHPDNKIHSLCKEIIKTNERSLSILISKNFPLLMKFLRFKVFNERIENICKDIVDIMLKTRKEQGIVRPDMLQMMMNDKNKIYNFTTDDMVSQILVFVFGGFDFASTSICFTMQEIGQNPDVQKKLVAEIEDILEQTNGKLTYEAITSMKYLDAVVAETLRLYPLLSAIDRVCVKDFEMPPATPDGKPFTIKPGECVWFPNYSLHRDPAYYPEPNKFNPDRFLNNDVNNSVYLPFGMGPRICIARRFILMEIKIILFYLLRRCELKTDAKTDISMTLNKKTFFITLENNFWLKLQARDHLQ